MSIINLLRSCIYFINIKFNRLNPKEFSIRNFKSLYPIDHFFVVPFLWIQPRFFMQIIIFGASGDLAQRKLFLFLSKIDYSNLEIIAYSRSNYTTNAFIKKLEKFHTYNKKFLRRIKYITGEYYDLSELKNIIKNDKVVYYLSVPPLVYSVILKNLKSLPPGKILIEKPYGSNLYEFNDIKKFIVENREFEVLLVDHYLLKEVMLVFNKIIKDINFNNKIMKKIKVISKEILGGEGRAFFDKYGIVMDLIQTHLMEILLLVLSGSYESEKRLKVVKDLDIIDDKVIFGQYSSYTSEIKQESNTDTFSSVELLSKSEDLEGVEILLVAGKGLDEKLTEIEIELNKNGIKTVFTYFERKELLDIIFMIKKVYFVINIYPKREIFLRVILDDGNERNIVLYSSDYILKVKEKMFGTHSDYALVFDGVIGDKNIPMVAVCEVDTIWKMFAKVDRNKKELIFYEKGSCDPLHNNKKNIRDME